MQIAVIIVTWNASNLLPEVLEALSCQTLMPAKVLVIDNDSQDFPALFNVVARYSFCELLGLQENVGFAAANNIGIDRCATFDCVALLNPDAVPKAEWLACLARAANEYPDYASFSSCLIDYTNPQLLDGAGDYLTLSGKPGRRGKGKYHQDGLWQATEVFSSCAAAALYRRSAMLQVGGFDEDFFCYIEDIDLGFRLRLAGYKARYVPGAVAHHVGSATTGGSHSDFSLYHGHRNLVWAFVKNMPSVLLCLLLPLHVVMNLISILWFGLQGRGRVIWRAKRDAVLGLPKMWRKRRTIQSTRIATVREIWRLMNKQIIPTG